MITEERAKAIQDIAGVERYKLFNIPGVHCMYPGIRIVNGRETQEECIVVVVSRKLPLDQIPTEHRIPKYINRIVRTDVVQAPQPTADGWCGYYPNSFAVACSGHVYDPETRQPYMGIPGGVSIGNANILDAGTLGCLVRDRTTRELLGLTSNHAIGPQVYVPSTARAIYEYDVTDNGRTFVISPVNQPALSAIEPTFTDYQSYPSYERFPGLIAGNLYKFNCKTNLHDFYISTKDTKQNQGGGGLFPYTTVSIADLSGNVRYNDGAGTGVPAASAGEVLYLLVQTNNKLDDTLYYGAWNYPNVGGQIVMMYAGVPPHLSKNRTYRLGPEYSDGVLDNRYVDIRGNKIGHPSNVDVNINGTGQVLLGRIKDTVPIKFCHPHNTVQPLNRSDIATVRFDSSTAEASQEIVGLATKAVDAKTAKIGDHVFKSGRTTGVTPSGAMLVNNTIGGYTNACTVKSTNASVSINYKPEYVNTVQATALFEDCIYYTLTGELFAGPGDSGSALLVRDATDSNKLKLAGIHIASGYTVDSNGVVVSHGYATPVSQAFNDLNLAVWEGTIIVNSDANCIMVDGICYRKVEETFIAATHTRVDKEFDDCDECVNE